jgi:predicted MPP superfamily phosphohydrolase
MAVKVSRRGFLKAFAHVMIASGFTGFGLYEYGFHIEPDWPCVEETIVPIEGLGSAFDGFRIIQLSDLHLFPYTEIDLIQRAVEKASYLRPDLIVLTGDYVFEKPDAIFDLVPILSQLDAKYGIYAILGNHDYWTNAEIVSQGFQEAHIPLLKNSGLPIQHGQQAIHLVGLEDGWSCVQGVGPDLELALSDLPSEVPIVLLMHEPDFADLFLHDERISLQLSGHSHGGQVRIPIYGAPILPLYGRKYEAGLYRVNQTWLYVNRGIGVIPPPIRLNCRPEITQITLTCQ